MEFSETRYRTIVESQTELICRCLPDGTLTFANQAFGQYFDRPYEQLIGQNFFFLLPPENSIRTKEIVLELSPSNPLAHLEVSRPGKDGNLIWQNWTLHGFFNERNQLVEVQAVGNNITERKLAELAATSHAHELSALYKATAALLATLDLETLLSQILDAAISAVPVAKKGMLYLIARDTGQLEMRAILGYKETDPRIQRFTILKGKSYVVRAIKERRPLLIHDYQTDPSYHSSSNPNRSSNTSPVRSVIVAPLILENHAIGALSLESSSKAAFNETDLHLVISFAATATAAIRNAQLHAEVQKQAITDGLTGTYNRRGFFDLGLREVERANRFGRTLAAIMLDIDNFKDVNDQYGHAAGDQVLQRISQILVDNIRRVDILGRYGGDEFAVLLPEIDMFAATGVAERLRQVIAETAIHSGKNGPIRVTASLGVAKLSTTTTDLEALLQNADRAMYHAKSSGRNRVEIG
jgi:diguanylate cyclase (GGDEF)-like protein/PAS domain S-box-containing protein